MALDDVTGIEKERQQMISIEEAYRTKPRIEKVEEGVYIVRIKNSRGIIIESTIYTAPESLLKTPYFTKDY